MIEPKTKTVHLLIEAQVDEAEGFTDEEYGKIAVGNLVKILLMASDQCDMKRGLVFQLTEGQVSYQKPRPITNDIAWVEDRHGIEIIA